MPSAVYLHDGEHQITVTFREEEDRERFKAHYRALDALAARYRDELVTERERVRVLRAACEALAGAKDLLGLMGAQLHARAALATAGGEGATT